MEEKKLVTSREVCQAAGIRKRRFHYLRSRNPGTLQPDKSLGNFMLWNPAVIDVVRDLHRSTGTRNACAGA